MRVGRLRKRITIQKSTETQDSYGAPVPTWQNYSSERWAEVIQESMAESFEGKRIIDQERVLFKTRYVSGVTPKMRVVYNSNDYDIESVENVGERNRFTHLLCRRTT